MAHENEIIVFGQFDNGIDANIAKTKLDAQDVPCFLTEENMAGLYPGQHAFAFRVRLHIFKTDLDMVSKILMTHDAALPNADSICPRCQSAKTERDFPKKLKNKTLTEFMLLFFGVFIPHKKVNHCLTCGNEF
jgi:hypothetical protein